MSKITKNLLVFSVLSFFLMAPIYTQANVKNEKITIQVNDLSFKEVIRLIRDQYPYVITYDKSQVDDNFKVSLNLREVSIDQVMSTLLDDTKYHYELVGSNVIIKKSAQLPQSEESWKLTGQVMDDNGEILVGVNVVEKGNRQNGTITDPNGKFSIYVKKGSVLTFSYIGFDINEVSINDEKVLKVMMHEQIMDVSEVVITGYQKIEKRKMSSAISSIEGEKILEGNQLTVDNMLQGKVAGLHIINQTSTPGAAPKIRIRGASSISGNREPVWVVDGVVLDDPVQISAQELNSLDNVNLIGNAISGINPSDIERIDVLKDASATAIYGSKAANGVIVITTKMGKAGNFSVNISSHNSVRLRPDYANLDRMNSQQRIDVSKEIYDRGLTFNYDPGRVAYEGALLNLYDGIINQDQFVSEVQKMSAANTDWYNELFETSFTTKNNVSISGGSEKMQYYYSMAYAKDNANLKNTGVEQFNTRANLSWRLNDKFKLNFRLSAASADKDYQHTSIDPYEYAYNTSRAIRAYDDQGNDFRYIKGLGYNKTPLYFNINEELRETGRNVRYSNVNLISQLNYDVNDALRVSGMVSLAQSKTKDEKWATEESYYIAELRGLNYGDPYLVGDKFDHYRNSTLVKLPYGGELVTSNHENVKVTGQLKTEYFKRFNQKHEINSMLGTEVSSSTYNGLTTTNRGYLRDRGHSFVNLNPMLWRGYSEWMESYSPSVVDNVSNFASLFGTFTYTYDERYSFNGNIRVDGSNKFGQDKSARFLPIWSVSGRYNLSNEALFDNVNWLNLFAIRASYGIQGNVHQDQTPYLIASLGKLDGRSNEYISKLVRLPNDQLTWEKTISYNIGAEFAIFKGRLSGDLDYYKKIGKDQIISKKVSGTTGANTMTLNAGDVVNKGWEFTLKGSIIQKQDFRWALNLNAFYNDNEITSGGLKHNEEGRNESYQDYYSGDIIMNGNPINGFYSYRYNGLDNNGLPTFAGTERDETMTNDEYMMSVFTYSGKMIPDFSGGFGTSINYKGWSLDADFVFNVGNKIRLNNLYRSTAQRLPRPEQNMSVEFVNRWQNEGDEEHTDIPVLTNDDLAIVMEDNGIRYAMNKWEMYNYSDLRVVSGDYLKLRQLRLRYELPKVICKKVFCERIGLNINASNLFTWADPELKGRDPEQISLGSGAVPTTKTFTFGFDVSF
ncbi:MAG: SusC/RagA family TonB-linked outer membrane protein [Carboxylicivirga sp.]|jgi:TonB-linked SusC/RagA family outer membrane protein|nr:SusC/RagA family TonB-linked outer membrane protein [Carboxylicivirga sp.]